MTTVPATDPVPDATAEHLRADMVDDVLRAGHARTRPVAQATREIPRHQFVPDTALPDAYAPRAAVVTKRGPYGASLSSAAGHGRG